MSTDEISISSPRKYSAFTKDVKLNTSVASPAIERRLRTYFVTSPIKSTPTIDVYATPITHVPFHFPLLDNVEFSGPIKSSVQRKNSRESLFKLINLTTTFTQIHLKLVRNFSRLNFSRLFKPYFNGFYG